MGEVITEKKYPIHPFWVMKPFFTGIVITFFVLAFLGVRILSDKEHQLESTAFKEIFFQPIGLYGIVI